MMTEGLGKTVKKNLKSKRIIGLDIEATSSMLGIKISLGGIISIEDFSPERVVLKLKRGYVILKGEIMNIVTFEGKRVEIGGVITELRFLNKNSDWKNDNDKT